jgi:ATP-dependent DNA helicase DinG
LIPPPHAFGLPSKFTEWREGQFEAVQKTLNSSKRFIVHSAPTGAGKSILAAAVAAISGKRVLILTSTKALQEQYISDFSKLFVDIRGQSNYICNATQRGGEHEGFAPHQVSVADAPCKHNETCTLKIIGGCTYYDRLAEVKKAQIVLGNYAWWVYANRYSEGVGAFDIIICDEAHELVEVLASSLAIDIEDKEIHAVQAEMPHELVPEEWASWAKDLGEQIDSEIDSIKAHTAYDKLLKKRFFTLSTLSRKLKEVARINNGWIVERQGHKVRIELIWPQKYAERYLFVGCPKIVLVSATIIPKTLRLMGIGEHEVDYYEYASTFPVERRPIYFLPVAEMKYGMGEAEEKELFRIQDQVIQSRGDVRSIIHAVSFDRQQKVLGYSRHRRFMIANQPGNSKHTEEAVKRFKATRPPAVLVSPSVGTGVDFPGDQTRLVIIPKVPYPNVSSPLYQARSNRDWAYGAYVACQAIVQMAGRAMRSKDDFCEVFILDAMFGNLLKKHRRFFPKWFLDALQEVTTIPERKAA